MPTAGSRNTGSPENAIRDFMWGYQRHFRVTMTLSAESLFRRIDPGFGPGVFLVGVRDAEGEGVPVAVEPERGFWLDRETVLRLWPEELSGGGGGERSRAWRRALREALETVLASAPRRPSDRRYFVAQPVKVGDYWVFAVLGLESATLETYQYSASGAMRAPTELPGSLLEVVIEMFLNRMEGELGLPEPFGSLLPGGEMLRTSAMLFTDAAVFEATGQYESGGFYDKCVRISGSMYEGTVAGGSMVIANREEPQFNFEVAFSQPPEVGDIRQARKLLETAVDFDLVTDGSRLYGLVRRNRVRARLRVTFTGHRQWRLLRGSKVLLEVKYDEPGLPRQAYDAELLAETLKRTFPKLTAPQTANLSRLIDTVSRRRHGALLVITDLAAREAKRLRSQAMPIERKKLTPALLAGLAGIDGAVLINPQGYVFAMGAILDGPATPNGNTARGARFNSAIRYMEYLRDRSQAACFITVVSDDGDTSFVPDFTAHPRASLASREPLYEEISDIMHYGRSLFARHDSDMIKMLFEPLPRAPREEDMK